MSPLPMPLGQQFTNLYNRFHGEFVYLLLISLCISFCITCNHGNLYGIFLMFLIQWHFLMKQKNFKPCILLGPVLTLWFNKHFSTEMLNSLLWLSQMVEYVAWSKYKGIYVKVSYFCCHLWLDIFAFCKMLSGERAQRKKKLEKCHKIRFSAGSRKMLFISAHETYIDG